MAEEFSVKEVKKAISSAKASSAPGPTGETIALYKYIFSIIPQTLTKALNQITFVPGLIESPTFVWLKERRIDHCYCLRRCTRSKLEYSLREWQE
jgi:hypothetical protein